jgi:hypothetical protein
MLRRSCHCDKLTCHQKIQLVTFISLQSKVQLLGKKSDKYIIIRFASRVRDSTDFFVAILSNTHFMRYARQFELLVFYCLYRNLPLNVNHFEK